MKILKVNIECVNDNNKYKWFVYGIKNKITNKYYIGSCTNKRGICDRFRRHIYHLKSNTHHSQKLQRSFEKYGRDFNKWDFFIFEEINKENYKSKEQYYIDKFDSYNNGYNSIPLVGVANHGAMSDKHKKAISDSKQNMLDMDIVNIFQKYNNGLHYGKIGEFYNVSAPTISAIINNNKYYIEAKEKYNLKKERYFYIFYNLIENKFYKVDCFSKFCRAYNLNDKMMMSLMLGKFKMSFIKNWTVFRKQDFSLNELRNRIKINDKKYILYKDNIRYEFKNIKIFCKEHMLDETMTYHVLKNERESVKGFTLFPK